MNIDNLLDKKKEIDAMITFFNNMIKFAEREQKSGSAAGNFQKGAIINDLKSKLKNHLSLKEENDKLISEFENTTTKPSIKVMHFTASHRGFDSDEEIEIAKKIRQFGSFPYRYSIDSGMSDEGVLFTETKVSQKEAQQIWDTICTSEYNEEPCLWEGQGELLKWNGKEIKIV